MSAVLDEARTMREIGTEILLRVLKATGRLSLPTLRALSRPIAWLIWNLAPSRRRITRTNLRLCFPDWPESRVDEVARAHFRTFVITFFERFSFWFGSPERIRRMCTMVDFDHIEPHLGQPLIVLAPHFVGLDAGGIRFQLEHRVDSMYAQQKSKTLTRTMTEGRSRFHGSRMILRTEGMRGAVRVLRDGIPFYFLPDMDLGAKDAVFVPFFGVPAATVTSVARLARIAKARVVPAITTLTPEGYQIRFYPAWENFPDDDIELATRRMNAFIEQRVLEAPEQYLWSHKRFKTRPEGEPGFY